MCVCVFAWFKRLRAHNVEVSYQCAISEAMCVTHHSLNYCISPYSTFIKLAPAEARAENKQGGFQRLHFPLLSLSGYLCFYEVQDYNCRAFQDRIVVRPPCVVEAEVPEGHQKLKKEQQMVSLPFNARLEVKEEPHWTKMTYLQHTAAAHESHGRLQH